MGELCRSYMAAAGRKDCEKGRGINMTETGWLRLLGAFFIVAGCTGMGFYYRRRLREALEYLRGMCRLLEQFQSEVRYGKATLPECCKRVGERAGSPFGEALCAVYAHTRQHTGDSFYQVWRTQMEKAVSGLPLTPEEKGFFLDFPKNMGLSDQLLQLRTIEQYRELLQGAVREREEKLEQQGRLAAGLGIMSGLLLTVLLL